MINIFKWFGNVILRIVFGAIGIFAMNAIFSSFSQHVIVGINPETMIILGLLGAPGFVMLYGISFCVNKN